MWKWSSSIFSVRNENRLVLSDVALFRLLVVCCSFWAAEYSAGYLIVRKWSKLKGFGEK